MEDRFHPAVAAWFTRRFAEPTEPQARAWPAIRAGRHALIAAPTGSGKTLAAFLAAIDSLVRQGLDGTGLADATQVVYVSPLKALSNDVQRNLEEPLAGIAVELAAQGLPEIGIRTLVRTGDTPAPARAAMSRRPPHILVTTPESLYILLTSEGGRRMLRSTRTVIVDEIHAVAPTKRGSHLALTLERLAALTGQPLQRIGLSATQRPVEEIARFLVGTSAIGPDGVPDCAIIDAGHRRDLDLRIEVPDSPLEAVMSGEVWGEIYDRLAEHVRAHRTTLVFVNTRRTAERVARHLAERLGEEHVTSHHGSLSRTQRLDAEQRLKSGGLRALVATASLELGIDIGSVDLVCTIGSTRSIATLLQRVGRSGHRLDATSRGRLVPTSRDELVECAALLDAVRRGELERLHVPLAPLDILAQQIVAAVAAEECGEDELFARFRRAWPYRDLTREAFDEIVDMLATGFTTRRGRRGAWIHHDAVHARLRARRGARLAAITSGGAIPDAADYRVVLEPDGTFLGTVDEDFAVESTAGDIFQLGNTSWRIRRVEQGRVLVEDARGEPPSIPFWLGEAPARSDELSHAVERLRAEVARRGESSPDDARRWLVEEVGLDAAAASQLTDYLLAGQAALGAMPGRHTLVLERFFDEAGNQHLVLHAPLGTRINRAWGLALRKRFCRKFNFELQAAATADAIVLSLGPTHSFPGEEVFGYLHSNTVREVLVQALLDAPLFGVRWRWNASRALAVLRWQGGRKVPPRLQRMQSEDLIAVVFPDQLACLENIAGDREIPDHPLVRQTLTDSLEEAMDIEGLLGLLRDIESGRSRTLVRDLREPSPLAHEVLNARPWAFLDDAPLEERRTQAVFARRWLDREAAEELGRLDPQVIAEVRREAWPEARDRDELHDALVTLGFVTDPEGRLGDSACDPDADFARRATTAGDAGPGWTGFFEALVADSRAARLVRSPDLPVLWVAAERVPELRAIFPDARLAPPLEPPPRLGRRTWTPDEARVEIMRGRLAGLGPVTASILARDAGIEPARIDAALAALEAEGYAMRGRFTPGASDEEWCERGLLARIHRRTIERLRREIRPVSKTELARFLLGWQHVTPDGRLEGPASLEVLLDQLEGFTAPAASWEAEILPARLVEYDPLWLDALCLAGRFAWARALPPATTSGQRTGPLRTTPIALLRRERLAAWRALAGAAPIADENLSADARSVRQHLATRGASFFDEIARATGLLRTRVERALAELVAWGEVTSDSFAGLRALLTPSSRRPALRGRLRGTAVFGMEHAGRWSLLSGAAAQAPDAAPDGAERFARGLLRRWGIVFRALVDRETLLPPWRELCRELRRLEARGEIRGGRFVDGFSGEQFALPEAVSALRAARRKGEEGTLVSLSAADPLNLPGSVLPGERLVLHTANRLLYRDGRVMARLSAGTVHFEGEPPEAERWPLRNELLRRRVPPRLRAYLGRPA